MKVATSLADKFRQAEEKRGGAKSAAGNFMLGGVKTLPGKDEIRALRDAREANVTQMVADWDLFAEISADDTIWADQLPGAVQRFREVGRFISGLPPHEGANLQLAYMKAALEKLGTSQRSAVLLGTAGILIGFLKEADENSVVGYKLLHLFLANDQGRWSSVTVTTSHPRGQAVLDQIRELIERVQETRRVEWQRQFDHLREGDTGPSLAAVLESGGIVTVKSPDEYCGTKFRPGGWITVVVENGRARITQALGKCHRVVETQLVPSGMSIPVETLQSERLDTAGAGKEDVRILLIMHGLIRRALVEESAGQ